MEQLLVYPREDLDIEIKGWLDLSSGDHRADIAQAILALANHGGGYVVIGFYENTGAYVPTLPRPTDITIYSQDNINGIVKKYADPPFHCEVHFVKHPESKEEYPVIVVPGGHRVPIRAKKDGPNGVHVKKDTYYIRRPGPASEPPQSSDEWSELIRRCVVAGKEDLISSIKDILFGVSEAAAVGKKDIRAKMSEWIQESRERWETLTSEYLNEKKLPRVQYGFYTVAYMIEDEFIHPSLSSLLDILTRIKGHESGWSPWWVPTRPDITPYPYNGLIECWIKSNYPQDQSHADFWRASPDGRLFLIRGYREDYESPYSPGEIFDLTLPVLRIGECLLHASRLAFQLSADPLDIHFYTSWEGLNNRILTAWANPSRDIRKRRSKTDRVVNEIPVSSSEINYSFLPALVKYITQPLYEAFDFLSLGDSFFEEEIKRLRGNSTP